MDLEYIKNNKAEIIKEYDLNEKRFDYLIIDFSQTNDFSRSLSFARNMYIPDDDNNPDYDKNIKEIDKWFGSNKKSSKMGNFIGDFITALICLAGLGGAIYLISLGGVLTIICGVVLLFIAGAFTWGAFIDFKG
jgi:hypothetical protein